MNFIVIRHDKYEQGGLDIDRNRYEQFCMMMLKLESI